MFRAPESFRIPVSSDANSIWLSNIGAGRVPLCGLNKGIEHTVGTRLACMAGYRPLGINSVAPAIASISQFSALYCTPDEPGGMRVALLNRNIAIIRSVSHSTLSTCPNISIFQRSPIIQRASISHFDVIYCIPDRPGGMCVALECSPKKR